MDNLTKTVKSRLNGESKFKLCGYDIVGLHFRGRELYVGVKMSQLIFTLDSVEAFEVNFPKEAIRRRFNLTLAYPSTIDFSFCS